MFSLKRGNTQRRDSRATDQLNELNANDQFNFPAQSKDFDEEEKVLPDESNDRGPTQQHFESTMGREPDEDMVSIGADAANNLGDPQPTSLSILSAIWVDYETICSHSSMDAFHNLSAAIYIMLIKHILEDKQSEITPELNKQLIAHSQTANFLIQNKR